MRSFWNDLRIGARSLAKARGFTTAVVTTLALAIALESSVVAVVNAYLIRSLPYPDAERLFGVSYARPGEPPPRGLAELEWASLSDAIEHPIAWDLDVFYLIQGEHPEVAPGAWVTPGFMQGLGIRPVIGRAFAPEEFTPGGPQVALISHALWRRRFGGDSAVLGRRFEAYVSDRPNDPDQFTIVGVLAPGFWHLNSYTDVLTPLRASTYPYIVKLREGVLPAAAEQRLTDLVRTGNPTLPAGRRVELLPVQARYTRTVKPLLVAIGTAVSLVLLIACANVAFLALIRGRRRQKEVAVRLALGAGKSQVARLLIAEAVLLSGAAAAAGSLLAVLLLQQLAPGVQQHLGRAVPGGADALRLDGTVAIAIGGLTLLIAAALTLAPLLATSGRVPFELLRRGTQSGSEGARGRRARAGLIATEVAGSLALLSACGLMVRTVIRMLDVDLGLQPARVVFTTFGLRDRSYPDDGARIVFYERLLQSLRQLPGVSAAALATPSPLTEFQPQTLRSDEAGGPQGVAGIRAVTEEYFAALTIPVVRGRGVSAQDRGSSEPVAVLSESAARRLWPAGNAVGRRIRVSGRLALTGDTTTITRTVVGVVRDVRGSPTDPELAEVYIPMLQAPSRFAGIVLQTAEPPASLLRELRRVLRDLDPDIALRPVQALSEVVDDQLARPRFLATLFAGFGGFAALLALLGVYGVVAYGVKQREREIAIRMALGASAGGIRRLFLREGGLILAAGLLAGLPAALGVGRLLQAQLYGVETADVATLLAASLGLGLACLTAVWWPSRRASAVEPAGVLKEE